MTTLPATVTIEGLGAGGDGVASLDGERIFVPLALPGERVRIDRDDRQSDRKSRRQSDRRMRLLEVLEPAPDRVEAPCPAFGRCGGCALQHLATGSIVAWKQQRVREALGRRGLGDIPVAPVLSLPPASRRRASFVAGWRDGAVVFGFHARRQHRIEDIGDHCLVLAPALAALLPGLRELAGVVLDGGRDRGGELRLAVTLTGSGPDILISGRHEPGPETRQRLASLAEVHDIARITWQQQGRGRRQGRSRRQGSPEPPEPLLLRRPARCRFGEVEVELPSGAFLQPGREGEAILAGLVMAAAAGAGRVVDLFAGCGAFGFALAGQARVHAVEGDRAAAAAMQAAANGAGLAGRLTVERRDLERRPLTAAELDGFDLAIIDPPRAGARAQAAALAASTVPVVVSVSCNPATFARDARLLIDGGYRPDPVVPVDQFPFTAHVELVGVFRRQPRC